MKLKTLFLINAVLATVFGIAFVVIPQVIIPLYGATVDAPLRYVGQLYGAALIGFAVLTWEARKLENKEDFTFRSST